MTGPIRLRGRIGERTVVGIADEPGAPIQVVADHLAATPVPTGETLAWEAVTLLAPVEPRTIVAFAKNYSDHAAEMGMDVPSEPVFFLKPAGSVVGPGVEIERPVGSQLVHYEAELAVVIGAPARDVPAQRAGEVILGYTCANDISARDFQARDGQWGRAKGFDTFCPLGPWITDVPGLADAPPTAAAAVQCRRNGELVQSGTTADMIFSVAELVAWTSAVLTLQPGDLILTGTPAGVGPIEVGDEVSVSIDVIGTLTNGVVARG